MQKKYFLSPVILTVCMFGLLIFGCNQVPRQENKPPDILVSDLDSSVNPGNDFFDYANGGWFKRNPIPASESGWGIGNLVEDEIYQKLLKINSDAAADSTSAKGTATQKIGDFWYSGMDSAGIQQQGLSPLDSELTRINAIKSKQDLLHEIAHLHTIGVGNSFSQYVTQDDKNSAVMALRLDQGGLGLPNRDYYFNTDNRTLRVRAAYPVHLIRMFVLMGDDTSKAARESQWVLSLETKLASSSRKMAALRDPENNYHKMSVAEMDRLTPTISWKNLLQQEGISNLDSVIVGQPEFYTKLDQEISQAPIEAWKAYLRYHLVTAFAGALDSSINKENFHFFGTILSGVQEQRPRWKRVLDMEESSMGELLGQLFVKQYFPPAEKKRYNDMVDAMISALHDRIERLDWMSDSTKKYALYKLSRITKKVGYPDKWKDFSSLQIDRGPLVLNLMRAHEWWYHYDLNKLRKPVDRTEWDMTPQTYNAYYNPSNNEIVLPAAQFTIPGIPDSLADDAMVYGYAAASTIGHEMTHGFDDQGRLYDADGNLRNWWTSSDSMQFVRKAGLMVRQFNSYVVLDSLHINGEASLGENIADFGGIVIGIDAFKKTKQYREGKTLDGLTPMQRYFLGYALGWLYQQRSENLARQILSDVHAPAKYRVNGPMSDEPEFYEAFNVKPGQPMWRPDSLRVKIW